MTPPRMSDVVAQLQEMGSLTETQRRDLISAVRRICTLIDRAPEDVPANINWVHIRLRRVHPASVGISKKTLSNIKSNVLKALELCGCSRERRDWLRPALSCLAGAARSGSGGSGPLEVVPAGTVLHGVRDRS